MDYFTFYAKVHQKFTEHSKHKEDEDLDLEPVLKEIDFSAESGWVKTIMSEAQAQHLIKMGFHVENLGDDIYLVEWKVPPKKKNRLPPGKPVIMGKTDSWGNPLPKKHWFLELLGL